MRGAAKEALLVEGLVNKVVFTPEKDKAVVTFDDGTSVEFRNGKAPRADKIKKLRLSPGDRAAAIGAVAGSETYAFGYDLLRSGKVEKGPIAIIIGKIVTVYKRKSAVYVSVKDDDERTYLISCPFWMESFVKEGRSGAFLCAARTEGEGVKKRKKYSALDFEEAV